MAPGRALIRGEHTRLAALERDGRARPLPQAPASEEALDVRAQLAQMEFSEMIALVGTLQPDDRQVLRRGMEMNLAISRHGLSLFPKSFVDQPGMVGNVTGMICDGAKIGCAWKTMTAVDAAFRSCLLALSGIGNPESDGIVGADGMASLRNLGRMAGRGMRSADAEILSIMRAKLV